ncbi:MAG: hypothetical protein KDJ14_03235 [Xanthomonadales bacterium]|nr:hypothetical protein [Xanthomonadales bacterium]
MPVPRRPRTALLAALALPSTAFGAPVPAVDAIIDGLGRLCEEATSIVFAPDESPRRFTWFCASDAVPQNVTCYDYQPAPGTVYVVDTAVLQIRCSASPSGDDLFGSGFE